MHLAAQNLKLKRGGRHLIADLSFEVGDGEALIFQGSNGAGKSSLLRAIAGFLPFSGGSILVRGGDPDVTLGEQTHYVGHSDSLRTALTAQENLAFWAQMLRGDVSKVEAALARLGLQHVAGFPVRALSAGQKRRVALARLLIASRRLWLLDEPTTALDAGSQALFSEVTREHLAGGGVIVAATHTPLGFTAARRIDLDGAASERTGEAA